MKLKTMLVCLALSATAGGFDETISESDLSEILQSPTNRRIGGIYVGRVRPLFVDGDLYLQPVQPRVIEKPGCASRSVLRLDDTPGSPVFAHKFELVLRSWTAGRELILVGKGTCSLQGEEFIFSVIPK